MRHKLPPLAYAKDALSPKMSSLQLEYHHDKHHAAYVENLNKLILGTSMEHLSLEEIIMASEGVLFNNAAQVWNHTLFFEQFTPKVDLLEPYGALLEAIELSFGSFGSMKEQISEAAISLFGSGWVWLVTSGKELEIMPMANASNPLKSGKVAILAVDVWEHAYYIDHFNSRADYMVNFWELIDWRVVESRYGATISC